jgi:preprotein translocase subunit YajC
MIELFSQLPLLQDGGGASGQLITTFVTFGLVIAIFYFLIIRPQNKRQKETKRMLEALKKGDRVVTIGGIRGLVQSVKDDTVVVKVDDQVKLEFSKSAVSNVLERKESKAEKPKEDTKDAEESS